MTPDTILWAPAVALLCALTAAVVDLIVGVIRFYRRGRTHA